MSQKFIKISICFSFLAFSCGLFYLTILHVGIPGDNAFGDGPVLTFSNLAVQSPVQVQYKCRLEDKTWLLKTALLESLIRASSAVEGQELRGLAVFSNLTDACQPPVDVSKSKIQVDKFALIYIANDTVCKLSVMAVNAQNVGYSVVVYVTPDSHLFSTDNGTQNNTQDNLLIPVLSASSCSVVYRWNGSLNSTHHPIEIALLFLDADRRNVEITAELQNTEVLEEMQQYLGSLYYWFLLSPLITLEWLRRTKKFCCMSGGQQVNEERGNEDEDTVGETNQYSVSEETRENDDQEIDHGQTGNEEQPLIIVVNYPHANRTTLIGHTGYLAIRRVTIPLAKLFGKFAVGCGYVILIVAALPVGISFGGLSFFRFDENEDQEVEFVFPNQFLILWWSSLQIYCFFLYSWVSCKSTWTVPTNFSKLIRSDWFASNMYLLIFSSGAPAGAEGARGRSSIPIENGKSIKPRKFGGRPRPYVRPYVRTYVRTD